MKITFLSPVRHDGKDFCEDDSAEMDDAAANALIEAGAAVLAGKKTTKVAPKATPKATPKVPEQTDADNADESTDSDAQDRASGVEENDGEGQS